MFPMFIPMFVRGSPGPSGPMPPVIKRGLVVYGGLILGSVAYETNTRVTEDMRYFKRIHREYKARDFFHNVELGFAEGFLIGVASPLLIVTAICGMPAYVYNKVVRT
jgi:hypothetical protein